MIHRLILLDRQKSIGKTLYDDHTLHLQQDLLIGLIQALMLLGESLGPSKGQLREAELGNLQLAILSKDNFAYAAIQDTNDNENFTAQLLQGVIDEYHDIFKKQNITRIYFEEDKIRSRVAELLTSMKFPRQILKEVVKLVEIFNSETDKMMDTLFLADLDDGLVEVFQKTENKQIIKILLEILSEIDFERQWIGESKLIKPINIAGGDRTHEVWIIHRVGFTDYILIGRAYYTPGFEREKLVTEIEILSDNIQSLVDIESKTSPLEK